MDILKSKMINTLVNAFFDYPMFTYILADETTRRRKLVTFFSMLVTHGEKFGGLIRTSENCEGVIHYLPPDVYVPGTSRWVRCGGLKLILDWSRAEMKRLDVLNRVINTVRETTMTQPFFYVLQIGVDPAYQGKGFSRVLFNTLYTKSDPLMLPCYLETFKEKNVEIYTRLGFTCVAEKPIPEAGLTFYALRHTVADGG